MGGQTQLVVIDARRNPWCLTRFDGRTTGETTELIVPSGASGSDVLEAIEEFRTRTIEPAEVTTA